MIGGVAGTMLICYCFCFVSQDASIKCTTNGNNQIIVCDSYGCIHLFNRNWEASTFKGHDGSIELCELSRQHNLLITVGVSVISHTCNVTS